MDGCCVLVCIFHTELSVDGTSDVWFINFYSPRCSHCHELAPAVCLALLAAISYCVQCVLKFEQFARICFIGDKEC